MSSKVISSECTPPTLNIKKNYKLNTKELGNVHVYAISHRNRATNFIDSTSM